MTAATGVRVAIFGATSGIATAVARRYAGAGARLVLIGRNTQALAAAAADLRVRGAAEVSTVEVELAATDRLSDSVNASWGMYGGLDIALVAYGSLPDQGAAVHNVWLAHEVLILNFVSPALVCNLLADRFEAARAGTIAVITSVAGDRGRKSNYIYGAAKGGMQRLLEGLRHRLYAAGVLVIDVRPGLVATRMTAHLPQSGLLWASTETVATDITAAIAKGTGIAYTPWFWRLIMAVVRSLPSPLFHRTSL